MYRVNSVLSNLLIKAMAKEFKNEKNLKRISKFLLDFADALMVSGTQTSRIVRNVQRLSELLGCEVDLIMLPKTIIMTLTAKSGEAVTSVRKISPNNPNFTRLSELRILSWEALSHGYSLRECESKFREIMNEKQRDWIKLALIVSIGNSAFCQLWGGTLLMLPLIFLGTFIGFSLRRKLLKNGLGMNPSFVCAAFISALIPGCGAIVFELNTDIALSTSVLWLIPGVPLLNAVIDLFDGHILAGFSRLVKAMELILSISFGLLIAIIIIGHSIV